MNRTIVLAILFILTVSFAIVTINTEYKFEDTRQMSNSISSYDSNKIYYDEIDKISLSSIEEFCSEIGMESWSGSKFTETGCKDIFGMIYLYNITYKDGYWNIGE